MNSKLDFIGFIISLPSDKKRGQILKAVKLRKISKTSNHEFVRQLFSYLDLVYVNSKCKLQISNTNLAMYAKVNITLHCITSVFVLLKSWFSFLQCITKSVKSRISNFYVPTTKLCSTCITFVLHKN